MTPLQKLREMLKDEAEDLRLEINRSDSDEDHYLDGKLQALRSTIEKIDALEAQEK